MYTVQQDGGVGEANGLTLGEGEDSGGPVGGVRYQVARVY